MGETRKKKQKRITPTPKVKKPRPTPSDPKVVFHHQEPLSPFTVRLHRPLPSTQNPFATMHKSRLLDHHLKDVALHGTLLVTEADLASQFEEGGPRMAVVTTPPPTLEAAFFELPELDEEEDEADDVVLEDGLFVEVGTLEASPFVSYEPFVEGQRLGFVRRSVIAFVMLALVAILPFGTWSAHTRWLQPVSAVEAANTDTHTNVITDLKRLKTAIQDQTSPCAALHESELDQTLTRLEKWGSTRSFIEALPEAANAVVIPSTEIPTHCPEADQVLKRLKETGHFLEHLSLVVAPTILEKTTILVMDTDQPRTFGGKIIQSKQIEKQEDGSYRWKSALFGTRLGYLAPPALQRWQDEWSASDVGWFFDAPTNARIWREITQDPEQEVSSSLLFVNTSFLPTLTTITEERIWNLESLLAATEPWLNASLNHEWFAYNTDNGVEQQLKQADFAGHLKNPGQDFLQIGRTRFFERVAHTAHNTPSIDVDEDLATHIDDRGVITHELTITYRTHALARAILQHRDTIAHDYLKIRLPAGAELTAVSGFVPESEGELATTEKSVHKEVFYEWEHRSTQGGVESFSEQGSKVISGWVDLVEGETAKVVLSYRIDQPLLSETAHGIRKWAQKIWPQTPLTYELLWFGSTSEKTRRSHTLTSPSTWKIHKEESVSGTALESKRDLFFGWIFERSSSGL